MKLISIVTPCYNEEGNVEKIYIQVKEIFSKKNGYHHEHVFIDNSSTDRTAFILKELALKDKTLKIIINTRNFGHIRSPFYGLLQSQGDAVILLAADLQEPPELISKFIQHWEEGYDVVLGVKTMSEEPAWMFAVRKLYYKVIGKLSEVPITHNNTGFGLYDKKIIESLRKLNDPYPFFRGLISELGYKSTIIEYVQPARKMGRTKNNFYTLYDIGMLGIVSNSKIPLRLATTLGFTLSIISIFVALAYSIYKLIFWNKFSVGMAPVVIGLFFFSSVQLFFLGIVGEYIGTIYTQVLKRPLVVEKERINF